MDVDERRNSRKKINIMWFFMMLSIRGEKRSKNVPGVDDGFYKVLYF